MSKDRKLYDRTWYARNKETYRPKKAELMRQYRAANPAKFAAQSRAAKRRLRERILLAFGRRCEACGFSDERALTLDHRLNNGAEERAEIGERGVYLRALKAECRHEYRMLCMNCQFITRHDGGRQNQHQQWRRSHGRSSPNEKHFQLD